MKEASSKEMDKCCDGESSVDAKQQDRMYDPLDMAEKGKVSDKLNSDSARYKQGPGPV